MKAMILAAGMGTHFRPLPTLVPKPMIALLGRPIMAYIVDHLRSHGVTEILVHTSHLAPQVEEYFRDGHQLGVQMAYAFDGLPGTRDAKDAPLGSAGGLRRVQEFSGFFDDTFIVLSGEAIGDVDLAAALAEHRKRGAIATVVLTDMDRRKASSFGSVVTDTKGRIVTVVQKLPERRRPAPRARANTGIYLFEPAIFDFIPSGEAFDINTQLFPALIAARAPFFSIRHSFHWFDISNAANYWDAVMCLLDGGIRGADVPGRTIAPGIRVGLNVALPPKLERLRAPLWIGGSTQIAEGATVIGPAAIGAGSIIEPGAHIERSIIWDHTRVTSVASLRDSIVSGGYCVSRDGNTLPLESPQQHWAVDDVRRLPVMVDEGLRSMLTSLGSAS